VRKRESDASVVESLSGSSSCLGCRYFLDIQNLNASEGGSMTRSHVHVELVNSSSSCNVSEFFIDVVCSGSTVISEEDTEVLDFQRSFLEDLIYSQNLSTAFLNFMELTQKVPKSTLDDDLVRSENSHSVNGRFGIISSGDLSSDDLVLFQRHPLRHPVLV
jgi:hypothetical protein